MQCKYILPTPHASKTACFSENQQRGMETKYSFAYFWETYEIFIVWIRIHDLARVATLNFRQIATVWTDKL